MAYEDRPRTDDYIDQAADGVGWAPIVLGIAVVLVLAFLLFGAPREPGRTIMSDRGEFPNTTPGVPSLPVPAPPRPQ